MSKKRKSLVASLVYEMLMEDYYKNGGKIFGPEHPSKKVSDRCPVCSDPLDMPADMEVLVCCDCGSEY